MRPKNEASFRIAFCILLLFLTPAAQGGAPPSKYLPQDWPGTGIDQWKNDQGKLVSRADWKGKYLLATLAFTGCQSTCPMVLRTLKQLDQRLQDLKVSNYEILVLSIDPQVDTFKALRAFRKNHGYHSSRWHFLTARIEAARKAAGDLDMGFGEKVQSTQQIMHTNKIAIINPVGSIALYVDGIHGGLEEAVDYFLKQRRPEQ
jgi:protein SCO1/2